MLLIDRRDLGVLRQADFAAVVAELAEDQLEKRRFADAVASDHADFRPGRNRNGRGIEKSPAPAVEHKIFDLQHVKRRRYVGKWPRLRKGLFLTAGSLR